MAKSIFQLEVSKFIEFDRKFKIWENLDAKEFNMLSYSVRICNRKIEEYLLIKTSDNQILTIRDGNNSSYVEELYNVFQMYLVNNQMR